MHSSGTRVVLLHTEGGLALLPGAALRGARLHGFGVRAPIIIIIIIIIIIMGVPETS